MTVSRVRACCAVAIPVSLLLLSGCTPATKATARLEGGVPVFAYCDARMKLGQVSVRSFDGLELYWQTAGPSVEAPLQIHYGVPPSNWTTQHGPTNLSGSEPDQLYIHFSNYEGDDLIASFTFSEIRESEWVTEDGRYSDSPCT